MTETTVANSPNLTGDATPSGWFNTATVHGQKQWTVVATLVLLVAIGLGFRAVHLGAIGFAEDEVNKVDAVRAYERGDITANAEHPMLMKQMMFASVKIGHALKKAGKAISDETLFRILNATT